MMKIFPGIYKFAAILVGICGISPLYLQGFTAYVTNQVSNNISVIDTETNTVIVTIATDTPRLILANPTQTRIYVAIFNDIGVIDTASNTVIATIPVGSADHFMTITPNGAKLYVANAGSDNVSVINTATNAVIATVTVGDQPIFPAVTPDGAKVLVPHSIATSISVINTATDMVAATISTAPEAVNFIATTGTKAYAAISSNVLVINTTTNMIIATIPVGTFPRRIAITPDGAKAYVTNEASSNVSVIDTSLDTVVATITVGTSPINLTITPDGSKVYVQNTGMNPDVVSVIDTSMDSVIATVTIGNAIGGDNLSIGVTPDGAQVYALNAFSDNVSVINTTTNSVIATVTVGDSPHSLAFGPEVASAPGQPTNLAGRQERNEFFTQIELFNVITWSAPAGGDSVAVAVYKIYRDAALTDLIGTIDAAAPLRFEDHNRKQNQVYTYFIVSESETGVASEASSIEVIPLRI